MIFAAALADIVNVLCLQSSLECLTWNGAAPDLPAESWKSSTLVASPRSLGWAFPSIAGRVWRTVRAGRSMRGRKN